MSYTEVFAWGSDEEGQLGLGENRTKRYYNLPRFCSFNVVLLQLACGKDHSMMIASTGYLYAMGSNAFGKLGIGTRSVRNCVSPTLVELKAKAVSCGFNHTVSLAQDGTVYAWGDNSNGQLGVGEGIYQLNNPRELDFQADQVSCGNYHTLLIQDSQLFGFGLGEQGQLGIGKVEKEYTPVHIDNLPGDVTQVAAGNFFSLFLIQDTVYYVGENQYTLKKIMNNATRIEASSFGAALTFNNELYIFGQSGVSKLEAVVNEFALGNGFGVVVNSKNQVCSFNINKMNPYVIDALEGKSIVKISAGEQHIMALGGTVVPQIQQNQLGSSNNIKSYSQSRLSSDGRRSEQLTGKISRQQSAAQLNAMLSQQKNPTQEIPGSNIVKRNVTESKQNKKPFQYMKTKENGDDIENYQTQTYSNVNTNNIRSITPTQNKKYGMIRNPLQHSNCQTQEYTSVNSVIGASKSSLFMKQNIQMNNHDDSQDQIYQKKMQDRCKSEYLQHNGDTNNKEIEELKEQVAELKQQLNDKENQMVVLQSECHDTTLKLNRKIRQLEDHIDQRDKKIIKLTDNEQQLKDENEKLINRIKELEFKEKEIEYQKEQEKIKEREKARVNDKDKARAGKQPPVPKQRSDKMKTLQKESEQSESFLFSQLTEQTPLEKKNQKQLAKDFLKISPIADKEEKQGVKTLSNYEVDESLDFKEPKQQELTPSKLRRNENCNTPPLPQRVQGKQKQQQGNEWWSIEKTNNGRPQTQLKQREVSQQQQHQSEVFVGGNSYKQNLSSIKSRLCDLQRNKSALENRMKQFEDRLKDKKQI